MEQKSELVSMHQKRIAHAYPKQKECWYGAKVRSHGILFHISESNDEGSWPCLGDSTIDTNFVGMEDSKWLEPSEDQPQSLCEG